MPLLRYALINVFFQAHMGWADCFSVLPRYHSLLEKKRKFDEGFPNLRNMEWIFLVHFQLAKVTLNTEYQEEAGQ